MADIFTCCSTNIELYFIENKLKHLIKLVNKMPSLLNCTNCTEQKLIYQHSCTCIVLGYILGIAIFQYFDTYYTSLEMHSFITRYVYNFVSLKFCCKSIVKQLSRSKLERSSKAQVECEYATNVRV